MKSVCIRIEIHLYVCTAQTFRTLTYHLAEHVGIPGKKLQTKKYDKTTRDAPIIGISQLVRWYRPIVIHTVGKYKLLFLLPKVNKHESGFHFR